MNLIVAVDKNWAIGINNQLLISIPNDMKYFKEKTMNKIVVMGKNTLESFPSSKPLKNRKNIVIALEEDYVVENCIMAYSIEEALELVKEYNTEDVFIIGGASIYNQMLPYCDIAYITKIEYAFEADTYFPNLDDMLEWEVTDTGEQHTYKINDEECQYQYVTYHKKRR